MAADHAEFVAFGLAAAHAQCTGRPSSTTAGQRPRRAARRRRSGGCLLVAESLLQSFAEHDGRIFHSVVHVDVGVAVGGMVRSISECLPSAVIICKVVERTDVSISVCLCRRGSVLRRCVIRWFRGRCAVLAITCLLCDFSHIGIAADSNRRVSPQSERNVPCAASIIRSTSTRALRKVSISSSVPMQYAQPTVRSSPRG